MFYILIAYGFDSFLRFHQMNIDIGFCIESRTDEEMPETLIGGVSINQAEPADAPTLC